MNNPEAIKPRIGQKLTHTAWILGKQTEKRVKLSASQVNLLVCLRIPRRMPLSLAGEQTGTNPEQRTALLLPLFQEGYIKSYPFPNEPGIELTKKGEDTLKKEFPFIEKAEKHALKGFDESEKKTLFEFLERIQENCISNK